MVWGHSHWGLQLVQVGDVAPSHSSPLPSSVVSCLDTDAHVSLISLQLFPFNSPCLPLLRLSVCLLDSYGKGFHVSPNLLMPKQEKIGYGERERGPG